jgi:hypothetical protein
MSGYERHDAKIDGPLAQRKVEHFGMEGMLLDGR